MLSISCLAGDSHEEFDGVEDPFERFLKENCSVLLRSSGVVWGIAEFAKAISLVCPELAKLLVMEGGP